MSNRKWSRRSKRKGIPAGVILCAEYGGGFSNESKIMTPADADLELRSGWGMMGTFKYRVNIYPKGTRA